METVLDFIIICLIVTILIVIYWKWIYFKPISLPPVITYPQPPEIFVTFPCKLCQESIIIDQRLSPGEVAIQECPNCTVSWTIYNKPLYIEQTKNLPEPLKSVVAAKVAQLNA